MKSIVNNRLITLLIIVCALNFMVGSISTSSALNQLPEVEPGCTLQIITREFSLLHSKLIGWAKGPNPIVLAEHQSTLAQEIHQRFGQCVIFIIIATDERLLLDVIGASEFAYRDRAQFLALITEPVDEHKLRLAFRSQLFYERHPIVILVNPQLHASRVPQWLWCIVCYLCDTVTQWQLGNTPIPSTSTALRRMYHSFNNNGNGRLAENRGRWWNRWFLYFSGENEDSRQTTVDIEPLALKSWRNGSVIDVFGNMLVHRFNLSFNLFEKDYLDADTSLGPKVILCIECHLSQNKHTEMIMMIMDEFAHLYCTRQATLQTASLVFFLRPFDLWTWACIAILTLILSIGLVSFGRSVRQVWYALDIVWTIVGIPRQNRKWPRIIVLVLCLLFFPSQHYIAYFTSDVLAPLQPIRIHTNQELFDKGYRIVSDRSSYAPSSDVDNFTLNRIEFNSHSFIEPDKPAACQNPDWIDWGLCLAAWPDKGTRKTFTKFAFRELQQIRTYHPDLFCTTVEEVWDRSVWLTLQFMGHLQAQIKRYVAHLVEAGILPVFWDGLYVAGASREFSGQNSGFVFHPLSFNTALLSVIQLYGILVALASTTLFVEIFLCRWTVSWRGIRVGHICRKEKLSPYALA